mmetsp:Transcript_59705/g.176918  ORF Transcript_59705/g.176918 Transcript_59705/m.176918 type:complete len:518 (-) Transcript_59705:427-1980(-)
MRGTGNTLLLLRRRTRAMATGCLRCMGEASAHPFTIATPQVHLAHLVTAPTDGVSQCPPRAAKTEGGAVVESPATASRTCSSRGAMGTMAHLATEGMAGPEEAAAVDEEEAMSGATMVTIAADRIITTILLMDIQMAAMVTMVRMAAMADIIHQRMVTPASMAMVICRAKGIITTVELTMELQEGTTLKVLDTNMTPVTFMEVTATPLSPGPTTTAMGPTALLVILGVRSQASRPSLNPSSSSRSYLNKLSHSSKVRAVVLQLPSPTPRRVLRLSRLPLLKARGPTCPPSHHRCTTKLPRECLRALFPPHTRIRFILMSRGQSIPTCQCLMPWTRASTQFRARPPVVTSHPPPFGGTSTSPPCPVWTLQWRPERHPPSNITMSMVSRQGSRPLQEQGARAGGAGPSLEATAAEAMARSSPGATRPTASGSDWPTRHTTVLMDLPPPRQRHNLDSPTQEVGGLTLRPARTVIIVATPPSCIRADTASSASKVRWTGKRAWRRIHPSWTFRSMWPAPPR